MKDKYINQDIRNYIEEFFSDRQKYIALMTQLTEEQQIAIDLAASKNKYMKIDDILKEIEDNLGKA